MMTVCACLWLGLFPLLQGGTYTQLTYHKWVYMLVLAGVTLAGAAAVRFSRRRKAAPAPRGRVLRVPVLAAAALALWILLSCLASSFGADRWLIGTSLRREGLVTQLCYLALFFLFSFARVKRKPVVICASAGVILFFAVVLLQRSGFNALGLYPDGRSFETVPDFQGTTGNIDMGNGYLCLVAGLLAGEITLCCPSAARSALLLFSSESASGSGEQHMPKRALRQAKRDAAARLEYVLFLLVSLGVTVFLVVTMDTEAGKITLAVLAVITLLQWIPRKWRLPVFLVLLVIIFAVVWFWPAQSGGVFELHEALHGRTKLSFGNNRIAVWVYSLALARGRLWTGNGSDTFEPVFREYTAGLESIGLRVPAFRDDLVPLPESFGEYLDTNHLSFLKPLFREYLEQAGRDADPAAPDRTLIPASFDMPHSEYIGHLVNHGLPAMLLFVALILSAVFCRRKKRTGPAPADPSGDRSHMLSPWAVAVLCYAVQAVFSFSICIVAPMFWVVLGACAGDCPSAEPAA